MNSLQNDFNIMVEECVRVQESFMRKGRVFCKEKGRTLSCFVYVLEGTAKYDFKNEKFIVNTGDIVSIIQNDTYSLEALGDTYHYIAVSYRVAKKDLIKFDTREYHPGNTEVLRLLFERINKVWLRKEFGYLLECKSILYSIIQRAVQSKLMDRCDKKYENIKEAVDYLYAHYTDKGFDITSIFKLTELSEGYFRILFKEMFNASPREYLNILRVNRAKDLMANQQLSISQISEQVGYSRVFYFSKVFKMKTGETPSQYRSKL